MIRGVLRTTIRKKLGETTSVFWNDSELNQWMNDAQLDIVWRTRCKRATGHITTVEDDFDYTLTSDLSSSFLAILKGGVKLYRNGSKWIKLDQTSEDDMDRDNPGWRSADNGVPNEYFYDKEEDEFIIYPKPNSSNAGTDYLKIRYLVKPTDMATDPTEADLPEQLHPAIIDYTVATGMESRGYGDMANDHWTKYYTKLSNYMTIRDTEEDEVLMMRPAEF